MYIHAPQEWVYHQIFGVGSEARNTNTTFPRPYGLVFDLAENQQWVTNIHAIDTRLVRDVRGCIECSCEETGVDTSQWVCAGCCTPSQGVLNVAPDILWLGVAFLVSLK
jgi:hypothetical protein